jgi:hypothetical protein
VDHRKALSDVTLMSESNDNQQTHCLRSIPLLRSANRVSPCVRFEAGSAKAEKVFEAAGYLQRRSKRLQEK